MKYFGDKLATRSGRNSAEAREQAIADEQTSRRLKRDYKRRAKEAADRAAAELEQPELEDTPPESSPAGQEGDRQQEGNPNPFAELQIIQPPQQPPVRMPYDTENENDAEGAIGKAGTLSKI